MQNGLNNNDDVTWSSESFDLLSEILKDVPESVLKLLKPVVGDLFEELQRFILESREPRLLLVGRRGAGKSSLINALVGEPKEEVGAVRATTMENAWKDVVTDRGSLRVMDSRGLGEGGASGQGLLDQLMEAIGEATPPDVVLFLSKAKEVDARISEDAQDLKRLLDRIEQKYEYRPVLVALATQVDELDPVDVLPPFDDPEKQANIEDAVLALREHLTAGTELNVHAVLPISAYMRFKNGVVAVDRRWNVDELVSLLIEQIPLEAQFQFVRITRVTGAQRRLAAEFVKKFSAAAGVVSLQPFPVADMPLLIALQFAMVVVIALLAGRRIDRMTFFELLSSMGINVATGFGLREAFRQLVKIFPLGSPVSAVVAIAGTRAIGSAAIAYFIDGQTSEQVAAIIARAQQEAEAAASTDDDVPDDEPAGAAESPGAAPTDA